MTNNILYVLTLLSLLSALLYLIVEFANFMVYGSFIKEDEMGEFLEKKLEEYVPNSYVRHSLMRHKDNFCLPFIAAVPFGGRLLGKWYIQDYGRVPRWSKWHRKIEAHERSLVYPQKPKLSQL